MIFVYFICLLFGVNVVGEVVEDCNIESHIKIDKKWSYDHYKNYKGVTVDEPPLPLAFPFKKTTEEEINKQINRELFAHYTYLSMATHFDRDDINLPGFHKFFKEASGEELKHAQLLMEYQNKRGGRVKLHGIKTPCKDHWGSGLDAMKEALDLEKHVYLSLLDLHVVAQNNSDPQLQDFLETNYLGEQVDSIKQLSNYVNTLTRLNGTNYALGEYQFDKITLGGASKIV